MKIFTIGNKTNNITIYLTMQDAEAVANAGHFRNEGGLEKLAADWPAALLVGIGNSLPRRHAGEEVQGSRDRRQSDLEGDSEPWRGGSGRSYPGIRNWPGDRSPAGRGSRTSDY
jgi:hypothetical protein